MLTTKNFMQPAPENGSREPIQRKNLDAVLQLEDIQKMFLPGSEAYYKVQDLINKLKE